MSKFLLLVILVIAFVSVFFLFRHSGGGGHICETCGRLTYANDDECGWCEGELFEAETYRRIRQYTETTDEFIQLRQRLEQAENKLRQYDIKWKEGAGYVCCPDLDKS